MECGHHLFAEIPMLNFLRTGYKADKVGISPGVNFILKIADRPQRETTLL